MPAVNAKIPYIQRVKSPDGKSRLYFRKGDHREGPLTSPDGSEELRAEVDAIIRRLDARARQPAVVEGTVAGMLLRYAGDGKLRRPSAEFLGLAAGTQAEYLRMVNEMREDCADVRLSDVSTTWLRDLRDAWAPTGYKAANDRRQVLKNALKPAIQDGRLANDSFAVISKLARPHGAGEAHPIWEDDETNAAVQEALKRNLPGLARALALARWAGFRRGTICAIPTTARIDGVDDNDQPYKRLMWITEKRKVLCDKPEDGRLSALLLATPDRGLTIAYNDDGKPWKLRSLSQAVERLTDHVCKRGQMRPGLTLHGLRHARGVELAEAGASDAEIMAQLEHATEHTARIYRRQAQRRKLARSGQDRVDASISRRPPKTDDLKGDESIVKSTVKKL